MVMNIHIPLLSNAQALMGFSSSSQTLQPGLETHQAPHRLPTPWVFNRAGTALGGPDR